MAFTTRRQEHKPFVPLLGSSLLHVLYEPLLFLSGLGRLFKRRLTLLADIQNDVASILDVGCGTGTHLALLGDHFPNVHLTGIDPDPYNIGKTLKKCARHGARTTCTLGYADCLILPSSCVDVCFSTLTFHHLTSAEKRAAFCEIYRVLKPNGSFILTDWGVTRFRALRWFMIFETQSLLDDHFDGKVPIFARDAGFTCTREVRVKPSGIWLWKFEKTRSTTVAASQ